MRNTKLYQILTEFTKIEQNRLRKFLQSPYFNANSQISDLFEVLYDDINNGRTKDFEKEDVWELLLPGTPFDDVRLRKYFSDLLKLVEQFISLEVLEDKMHMSVFLLEAVKKRKIEKLYKSSLRVAKKQVEDFPFINSDKHLYAYQVEKSEYEILDSEIKRVNKSNIDEISGNLDAFFIAEKLKYYSSVLTQQQYVRHDYKVEFMEEIFEWIKNSNKKQIPAIDIYYQICLTTLEPENEKHYERLKELLTAFGTQFPKNEAITIYYSAINYCIRNINRGRQDYNTELFRVYKEMVEKDIVLSDRGEVSPWDFKNITQSGMRANELNWTEQFILDYGEKIPEKYRKNAVTFNLGQLYFYQKRYEDVLMQLRNVEYDDITYALNSKAFLTWAYLELDEIELLMFHIESFRTYINRHKDIHGNRKRRYHHFLRFAKKLSKTLPGDTKALDKLKKDLEVAKEEGVVGLNWIQTKIAEME